MNGTILLAALCAFLGMYLLVYALLSSHFTAYTSIIMRFRRRRTGFLLVITPLLQWVVRLNRKLFGTQYPYLKKLKSKVRNAGISIPFSAEELIALQEMLFLLAPLMGGGLLWLFRDSIEGKMAAVTMFLLILGAVAAMLPVLPIDNSIANRRLSILKEWPYFLDLLTLSMESGMDMTQAVERIIECSPLSPLTEELMQLLNEIRLGSRRTNAIKEMAARINIPSISAVLNMIVQAELLGTELAPLLRIQAREFRERRAQLVEKAAMESPVKMMLPLLGCIFPAVMIILLGPSLLQYYLTQ
ncbi:MAG: type II secretion system F family protein [Spartobacteria bacterium]|nr:type II secretion system F family protein [Spartobacteria bacterium]